MFRTKGRIALALVVVAGAIFVVAGGPATAGKLVTKNQVAPSAITTKAIANGAVTADKLSKSLRRSLKGANGANGAAGANGANGAAGADGAKGEAGARGAAGAFNVVDANGKVIGTFAGFFNGNYMSAYTADGALLIYDPNSPQAYPSVVPSGPIFYKQAACAGQAYGTISGYPIQTAIILEGPPTPGSKIYVMTPAASAESFTYQSLRTSSGCATSSSSVSNAYPAHQAGTLPSIVKPLTIVPAT